MKKEWNKKAWNRRLVYKRALRRLGLTECALARKSGISRRTLLRYLGTESVNHRNKPEIMAEICRSLRLQPEDLGFETTTEFDSMSLRLGRLWVA
ncbi:MAG: helix-turn-helix transcriptional regulator [Acidobacteriales bacterium]|nr:helix-turn-helix transcriptional regulator [Terriglobales bacterium]